MPQSKNSALAPSVTTRDPKVTKFMSIVDTAYNKTSLSEDEAQRVNDTPGLSELIENFVESNRHADKFKPLRLEWQKFYKKLFKLRADFSGVRIPEKPTQGSWRLIFIPAGLTLNVTLAAMRAKFQVWVYTEDLDAVVTTNTRTSAQSYAIWVRDGVEPDTDFLGKSTRQADMDGKIGMTLLERMVFEVKFFVETGEHLDYKGVTLCTGSRDSGGDVPHLYFDPSFGKVRVDWYRVDGSNPTNGLRQKF